MSQGLLPFPVSLLLAPEGALSHHGTRIPASRRGLSRETVTYHPFPACHLCTFAQLLWD